MARAIVDRTYTPAQRRILDTLSNERWMNRADIAKALGRSRLYPNEVSALIRLAESDAIDEVQELIGNAYVFFYRKR